jgi:PAS domain S-box-containing protein
MTGRPAAIRRTAKLRVRSALTASRSARAELDQLHQDYADLYDFAPVGCVAFDRNGVILNLNLTAAGLLGRSRQCLVGTPFLASVATEDHPKFLKHLNRLRRGQRRDTVEINLVVKGQIVAPVQIISEAVKRAGARKGLFRMAMVDLTGQKALRESRARLAAFAEASFEGLVESEGGRILDCNDQFARMLGYPAGKLKGAELASLIAPEDQERVLANIRLNVESVGEHAVVGRDGTRIIVEAHGRPATPGSARRYTAVRDITRRKRAEEALQVSEKLFRTMFRDSSVGMVQTDPDTGRFLRANSAFCEFTCRTENELLQRKLFDILHPDDRAPVAANLAALLRGDVASFRSEQRYLRQDGTMAWGGMTVNLIRDAFGRPLQVMAVIQDITRRKHAEDALRKSEQIYRAIGESINYGIWICSPDGRNTYASESFLELVGLTQQQCSDFGWGTVLHPEDAERTIAAWKECVRTGGTWDMELRFRAVDGQYHDILARGVPVKNSSGEIFCWAGIALDITQRKRAQEALRQSEAKFSTLFHQSSVAMALASLPDARLYDVNRACLELIGISRKEDAIGRTVTELGLITEAAGYEQIRKDLRRRGSLRNVELPIRTRTGISRELVLNLNTVQVNGNQCVLATGHDVTERKWMEGEMRQLNATLEKRVIDRTADLSRLNAALGEEIARTRRLEGEILNATEREQHRIGRDLHDGLGQLTTAAAMMSEGLKQDLLAKRLSPDAKVAGRIQQMCRSLGDQARRLAHGLNPVAADPDGLKLALQELAEFTRQSFRVPCQFSCPSSFNLADASVANHLFRIAQEAVNNAVRHGRAKDIKITLAQDQTGLTLAIADNGSGLPTAATAGDGMGLQVMRHRASLIGAAVRFESVRPHGTKVICSLAGNS